jgi:uncharacterized protein Smg (DUF494 family)
MRNNLVDLIVLMARKVRLGESLNEIKDDTLSKYNKSEISAAYSWIIQKYPGNTTSSKSEADNYHRVLHYAERMLISPEAHGYLLELVTIGILDQSSMEGIIEKVMFHSTESIGLEKIKSMVQEHLFENLNSEKIRSSFLRGNESVN